jgi:hypothetical protein
MRFQGRRLVLDTDGDSDPDADVLGAKVRAPSRLAWTLAPV